MKSISVEITGTAALLQHKFGAVSAEQGLEKTKGKKKVYDPQEEANNASYRDETGKFVQPSEHIYGAMIHAASGFVYEGKKTYKDIIKRGVVVAPECEKGNIPLLDKKGKQYSKWDEIDARRAVVMRAAITRWRPMFYEGWKLRFNIDIIDDENLSAKTLKEILEKAGYVGIGDYRPRFGRFQVTSWKENGKA